MATWFGRGDILLTIAADDLSATGKPHKSELHEFILFALRRMVNFFDKFIGELLQSCHSSLLRVFGHLFIFL